MSGRRGGKGADSCLIPFHTFFVSTLSSGLATILANPVGLSARAGVEADAWALFRVRSLSFRLHALATSVNNQAAGFVGGVQDTPPGTIVQVGELLPSCLQTINHTAPTEWVKVAKKELSGPFPWYKSIAGGPDASEESPGAIMVAGASSDGFNLEIRGVIEFKTAVSTGNTPLQVALHERIRQERVALSLARDRTALLRILQGSPALAKLAS
jgi:hypothetical protein